MYLGYYTACLRGVSLEEKIQKAKEMGFESLELACWPQENDRDFSSSDIPVHGLTQAEADRIRKMFDDNGLKISSLGYYDNSLSNDPAVREKVHRHTYELIDAAQMLGVDIVGLFAGRNIDKTIEENFDEFETVFNGFVNYAGERGIKIVIENCPMLNWLQQDLPGTITYSPELWDEMFRRVPQKNFGLNFDPSHLLHLMIDYVPLIEQYKDRIFHVHAKDAEIFPDRLHRYGIYDCQLGNRNEEGWWRFRMPGMGQVDFPALIEELKKIDYQGAVSIEHEDPVYEGSNEKIYEGLQLGYDYLKGLVK